MKRLFPWIVVLITLSLAGIIFIQVNWIKNAINMRQEQFDQRMFEALDRARTDIVANRHPDKNGELSSENNTDKNPINNFWQQFPSQIIPVNDRYTLSDIHNIIDVHLKNEGFNMPFQFAVTSEGPVMHYEMYSSGWPQAMKDTLRNKGFMTYLVPDNASISNIMGLSHEVLHLFVPADSYVYILRSMSWIIGGSILFTLIIITAFALTVFAMLRQKKLSDIKSDFINNMTHEFKTPLATISLAIDAIGNEKVVKDRDKILYFSGIIKEENKRMHRQVETILQSALLDRQDIRLNPQAVDVHEIIQKSVHNLELQLKDLHGEVRLELNATNSIVNADEVHFSNMISNLLDNALKYSEGPPLIILQTANHKHHIVITVTDNGIGMNRETLARIFEKFYRAHTGNLHNVKGFGLGLAYVKAIVDAHDGKIRVESSPGKGSKFEMEFPQQTV